MSLAPLAYRIRAYWNGAEVLDAGCTATMAADIASGFMRGNFAGERAAREVEHQLHNLLDRVLDGQSVSLEWDDATGKAAVSIWRPLDATPQIGTRATINGRAVVMGADGWRFA